MAESGLFGGTESATRFSDGDRPYLDIVSISIFCGWYIDALRIGYQDKTIGPVLPINEQSFTMHGGAYTDHELPIPIYIQFDHGFGEVLTGLDIAYGHWINTLTIYTNFGRQQTFGGADNHPGPQSTTIKVAESNQRIYSLKGESGWYINKLGIYYE